MSNSFLLPVRSVPATDFIEGLAQNQVTPIYNLKGLPAQGAQMYLLHALLVLTKENYGPRISLFQTAAGFTADPATDTMVGLFSFTASNGVQLGGGGLWRYYYDILQVGSHLAVPYQDLDVVGTTNPPTVHMSLDNTENTAKSAGANGATKIVAWFQPMQAF